MDRIIGANTIDLGGGRRGFRGKDTVEGHPGTELAALWHNAVQEEILNVIEAADMDPTNVDLQQLLKAIRFLARTTVAPLIPRVPLVLTVSGPHTFAEDGFYDLTLIGGGGGGSGGYGSSNFTVGGNGGGSGYVRRFSRFYAAGTTINLVVGAGGFKGTRNLGGAAALPGGDGGATTFDGVSAKGGKGATAAVLATTDTGVEGDGRNNGFHGNYLIGPDATSVQMVPGQGGRGYLDTVNDTVAYGEGGRGGLGANDLSYLTDGAAGLSGALVIE